MALLFIIITNLTHWACRILSCSYEKYSHEKMTVHLRFHGLVRHADAHRLLAKYNSLQAEAAV